MLADGVSCILAPGGPSLGLERHEGVGVDVGAARSRRYSSRQLKMFVVGVDSVAIGLGMLLAYAISSAFDLFETSQERSDSLLIGAVCLPVWLAIFSGYGLYKTRRVTARLDEFAGVVHATLASTVVMAAVSYLVPRSVSRAWLIISVAAVVAMCLIGREFVRRMFSRLRRSRRLVRSVVLVGSNAEAGSLCEVLRDPAMGYQVVAVVGDADGTHFGQIPILGVIGDIRAVVEATGAKGVIVATTAVSDEASNRLVRELIEGGVHVELSSSLRGIGAGRLRVRPLGATPVIYVEPVRRGGWRGAAKRSFDIAGSGLALLVLAPFLLLVGLAVRLGSPGRIFFVQERVGKDALPFRLFKFRTMVHNAEAILPVLKEQSLMHGVLFKAKDDPRVTKVGRVLRRFSIDEFPQLINVLRGEMSLVGPRPALFSEMEHWTPELMGRLRVQPGLTGMWQVSGRSDLSFADYVRHDLYYVENWSLLTDLAIVAKTVPVVFGKRGAY